MWGKGKEQAHEGGFTLVELLITVVLVGVLTVVGMIGLNGLAGSGSTAACQASMDAAKAATAVYYTQTGHNYPQAFDDLTSPPSGEPLLEPAANVTTTATTLSGKGWTVNLIRGPTTTDQTTFSGC